MSSQVEQAMRQICEEKGLSYEAVLETIESALAAAYRKDFGNKIQNIEVEYDVASGKIKAFDVKTVVEDVDLAEVERVEEERRATRRSSSNTATRKDTRSISSSAPASGLRATGSTRACTSTESSRTPTRRGA